MTLTDPTHADRPPAAPAVAAPDRVGRIETHGIDHIPDAERHGRPIELFWVWAGANVNYLSLVVGGTLVLMGLSLPQALAVIVIGNLGWLLPGFLSVSGPAAGAPSEVITRAMYGVRGNRVYTAISGWVISVCYFALNLAADHPGHQRVRARHDRPAVPAHHHRVDRGVRRGRHECADGR